MIIDVRSPREFREGSIPGSVNLPLLDDEARAQVGTAYVQQGGKAARLLALDLLSPNLSRYVRDLLDAIPEGKRPAVLCWRGGERSRNVVLFLALVGVHAVQIKGGYRAYRRWVREGLATWQPKVPIFTLYGYTGSGKTRLLRAIRALSESVPRPRPWVLDLEALALHRGSLLGSLNQPAARTQKDFEALLWEEVREAKGDFLVTEGESRRIGPVAVPERVAEAIRSGVAVWVETPLRERVQHILEEYAPYQWTPEDSSLFLRSLARIGERLSGEQVRFLRSAFNDGRFEDVATDLLTWYYDPLYQKSSVEGKEFALRLDTSCDAHEDARKAIAKMRSMLGWGGSQRP